MPDIDHDAIRAELEDADRWAASIGVSVDVDLEDDHVHIVGIQRLTGIGAKGAGARAIGRICAIADAHGLPVDVEYVRDEKGLGPYYARLGFEPHFDDGEGPTVNLRRHVPQAH